MPPCVVERVAGDALGGKVIEVFPHQGFVVTFASSARQALSDEVSDVGRTAAASGELEVDHLHPVAVEEQVVGSDVAMQKHRAFQIVTPQTLQSFSGPTLVLPDVSILDSDEKEGLRELVGRGIHLIVTGNDATGIGASKQVIHIAECPGKKYNTMIERDFEHASPDSQESFLASLAGKETVRVDAGPHVATSISRSADGSIKVFFANFSGLRGGVNPVQKPQTGIIVAVESKSDKDGWFLPFMGEAQPVKGIRDHKEIRFSLPTVNKGGVFSFERAN